MRLSVITPLFIILCLNAVGFVQGFGAVIRINEFVASNGSTVADEDGDFEDWIEIFNAGDEPANLGGWGLSDDIDDPFRWTFPAVVLGPEEYLLVWASGKDRKPAEDDGSPDQPVAPDEIDGLVSWFKADAEEALGDGDSVSSWTDQSGLGNHATQSSSTARPVFRDNAINGLPAIEFNGQNQQFSLPHESFAGMIDFENFTLVTLVRWNGKTTSGILGTGPSNANSGNVHFEITSGGGLRLRVGDMNGIQVGSELTPGSWEVLGISQFTDEDNPVARLYRDGAVLGTRQEGPGNVDLAAFGGVFLGNSHDSSRNFGGLMAEVILFDHSLSSEDRRAIEWYLREKYQLDQVPGIDGVPLHANFRIDAEGEPLLLTRPDGSRADEVDPTPLPRDVSLGRSPDGTGDWVFFPEPTPLAANTTQAYALPPVTPPAFSHGRGFYTEPFALSLEHADPDVAIFYTLDGSPPSEESGILYADPIPVETTAVVRAIGVRPDALPAPQVMTHTYLYLEDVIDQPDDPAALGFPDRWGSWTDVHYGMSPEITGHRLYSRRMMEALTSIPTVSLVIDMDDMFDSSTGIYANRTRKGFAWERPVSMEVIRPGGEPGYQVDAGLRAQGGASRNVNNTPKGSLRVLFKSEYGSSRLEYPFFLNSGSDLVDFNTITFRAEYNNEWLHWSNEQRNRGLYMRDRFIRESQIALSGSGSHSEHVHLYINGVYWGLYNPSERIDAAFGSTHFGGEREEWDAYTHNGVRDGNRAAWDQMVSIANSGLSSLERYEAIQQYLDVPHYIDYMIVNIWAGMHDWPFNNWNAIRRREEGAGFKFYCWDSERAMEGVNDNRVNVTRDAAQFYAALRQNPEFRLLFADHVQRHLFNEGALATQNAIDRFVNTAAQIEAAVIAESARWGSYRRDKSCRGAPCELYTHASHWTPEYNRIVYDYLPRRTDIVVNQFRSAGLYPGTGAPAFSPRGGIVQSNTEALLSSSAGTIYYTLNGEDPRMYGSGAVSPDAIAYEAPLNITEDTVITARVLNNGEWSALDQAAFALPRLEPHLLSAGPYAFEEWSPDSPAGTYPSNMIFEQVQQGDPGLTVEMDGHWELPYNLASRSRINGLGSDGISFINTANAQEEEGAGYLGSAVLALDTTGEENIRVQWTAGTVTPNSRVYGLRLQYRVGATGAFTDVPGEDGEPLEYRSSELPGHVESFGPVTLPSLAEDEPYVELRWKYHHILGDSGPRAEVRFDDILVASGAAPTATALVFDTPHPAAAQSGGFLPALVVRAINEHGLTDTSFASSVTLSAEGGGSLDGETVVRAEDGVAVFDGVSIVGAGPVALVAQSGDLAFAETEPFSIVRLTEIVMPQVIQGDQDANDNNEDRVPFAFRLQLEGLLPGATYRYGNRVVDSGDPAGQDGAGNSIFVTGSTADWIRNTNAPRFAAEDFEDRHFTFTTDDAGAYTGWFVTEPTGNPRFTPGNTLFVRLLLNDGQDGEEVHHILTAPSGIEVRRFGGGEEDATAVYGDAQAGSRNFVLLYGDEEGSGRPISATVVEDVRFQVDYRYADFYLDQVAQRNGRWGTLLPNTLSSGVRRLEERSLATGDIVAVHTFPTGFEGTIDPRGGVSPVFADIQGGAEFLPINDGDWHKPENWSGGKVPGGELGDRAIVSMTAESNRTVLLKAPVTLSSLILNNETPYRNRIEGGLEAPLTFQSNSGEASLVVGGQGSGFHEFQLDEGITLESDLRITVNNIAADGEYGALRIREPIVGLGSLIKDGFGILSLTGGDKNYRGATIVKNGVLRITESSQPQQTSRLEVSSGGQLRLVSHGEDRVYTLGGLLTLDSLGPAEGPVALPQAGRLGALRLDPELEIRESGEDRHTATITSNIEVAGDSHVHVDGTANRLTLSGNVFGSGALIKSGGGDLVLAGDNALFEGGTLVRTGALRVEAGSGIGLGPLSFHAHGGADLDLVLENVAQTVSLLEADVDEASSATVMLGDGHLLSVDQEEDSRFQGMLTGPGSLRKTGEGILRLTQGANDFTGALEIDRGVLEVTESSHPFLVSRVAIQSGGQIRLTSTGERAYSFGSSPLILQGAGRDAARSGAKGALRQQGDDSTDIATVTNPIELAGDVAWIHANRELGDGSTLILAGELSGSAALRKTGGGTLELRGANMELIGGTLIENGLLRVREGSLLGAGPLTFVDPERERFLELRNDAQTVRSLSGAVEGDGSIAIELAGGHTFTVDQTIDSVFEGSIIGSGDLVKTGSGSLVLAGDNDLTGTVSVHSGILRIGGMSRAFASVNVFAGARLEGVGAVSVVRGAGMVSPGSVSSGILDAESFDGEDGLGAAFVFTRTGSPDYENAAASGNDVLRLSGEKPFIQNLDTDNTISVYLNVASLSGGDHFRGGFFTKNSATFDDEIHEADLRFFVRDPLGDEMHRGLPYRAYDGPLQASVHTIAEEGGRVMEISWSSGVGSFNDWQDFHFPDPEDRNDPNVSGALGDANGDGVMNLMKYALGLGPRVQVSADRLRTVIEEPGRLAFRFYRDPAKNDIAYIVETSTDLLSWEAVFDSRTFAGSNNSGEFHEVLVPAEPDPAGRTRFARLRVVQL